jgi:hypothetical protein
LRNFAIAGADLSRILEPAQLKVVLERLSDALGWRVEGPGQTVEPRAVPLVILRRLLLPALIVAAGGGPSGTALKSRPLLWDTGPDQLLLHLAKASIVTGAGLVDLHLPVTCDQTGAAEVVITYLTASPDRPHGFVVATEDRPRGPAVVVQVWGEALVALGWRALVELAGMIAATRGSDATDRPLVASTVVATPEGLVVTAMGGLGLTSLLDSKR